MYLLRWQKLNLKSTKCWRLFLGESFWISMHYFQRTVNITSNLNFNALFSDNSQITSNLFGITRQCIRGYRDILQNLKFFWRLLLFLSRHCTHIDKLYCVNSSSKSRSNWQNKLSWSTYKQTLNWIRRIKRNFLNKIKK